MIQRKRKPIRRVERKAPPPTEFQQPRKRKPFTVFLVEDDQAVRAELVNALTEQKIIVRDYMTAMEFYRDFRETTPGVLILDIRLPGMTGPELQQKLMKDGFELPLVMIAGHADVPAAVQSMKDGAFDFLCKPLTAERMIAAIERSYNYYYDVDTHLFSDELDETEKSLSRLTGREKEVLDFVVDGLSSREIAEELGVSAKTVEAHRARINDKMRADDVAHLIRICFAHNEQYNS